MLAPKRQTYLVRSVVTVVAGGCSFALTNGLTPGSLFEQLALSVFVGGFILLVQLLSDIEHRLNDTSQQLDRSTDQQIELDRRMTELNREIDKRIALHETRAESHEERTLEVIKAGLEDFGETTALLTRIMQSGFEPECLIDLVRRVADLTPETPPLVVTFLQGEIERLTTLVKGIVNGKVEYEGEDRNGLLGFTRSVVATMDAISLPAVDSQEFWASELGVRYLTAQREAIDRGVAVRRVFIFDQLPGGLTADLVQLFDSHAEFGIQVRFLLPQQVPPTFRTDLRDFIVFDGSLSFESTPGHHVGDVGGIIQSTHYVLGDQVIERESRFEELWRASTVHPTTARRPGDRPRRGPEN